MRAFQGIEYFRNFKLNFRLDILIIMEERSIKDEITDKYSNVLNILLKSKEDVGMRKQIQQDMIPYFSHKQWRVRLRSLLIYHICNHSIMDDINQVQKSHEIAIKMLEDKDNKVFMTAWSLLISTLKRNPEIVSDLTRIHKLEATKMLNLIKNSKKSSEEMKEMSSKLKVHAAVILCKYSTP